jgi:hypothetical protein
MGEDSKMKKVTRKELVENVLRPAFQNENFEDTLKEIIVRLRVMYPEVAEGYMNAVKETHRKAQEK